MRNYKANDKMLHNWLLAFSLIFTGSLYLNRIVETKETFIIIQKHSGNKGRYSLQSEQSDSGTSKWASSIPEAGWPGVRATCTFT